MQSKFILTIAVSCALAVPCVADQTPSKAKRRPKPAPVVQPVAPPVVLTPEQMPALPPQVAYAGGQLTITSQNSTLGDILRAVRKQTGASVEVPGNATERVVGKFGPGPARDVLASLLNGSHFNYVLLGSATNPYALDRVILTSKSGGDAQPAPTEMAAQQNQPGQPQEAEEPGEKVFDDGPDAQQNADIFGTPDDQGQSADDQNGQQANPFGQQPANVRTPEQLLQEMQQRQQQMQQQMQQQQQNPGSPPGFPGMPRPQQPEPH